SKGNPIIDRNLVIASSNSGRTIASDLATGTRFWETNFGSSESLWVAGEYIYLVTTNRQLVCLARRTGKLAWATQLKTFENSRDKENPIEWTGPVLAGDRILVGGSNGEVWSVSPFNGKLLGKIRLSGAIYLSPVVANGIVYLLADNSRLYALR
ncbi:MAG: PQQ-binding-like beta-propeller repeat protein, partial [Rhodospirillaceae bacterium]